MAGPGQELTARVAEEQLAKLKASTKGAEGTGPWQIVAAVRILILNAMHTYMVR